MEYEIICITETWLHKNILDSVIICDLPYSIIRSDRNSKKGGGCCILIANHIAYKIISTFSIYDADIVSIDIFEIYSLKTLRLINIYSPPSFKNTTQYNVFIDYLSELCAENIPTIIVGDLNVPNINWSISNNIHQNSFPDSSVEKVICDFANCHVLKQHITFPTRKNNILDILFTNDAANIKSITPLPPFGINKQSDHISFSFDIVYANAPYRKTTF